MPLLLVAASVWMALSNTTTGEYFSDTMPSVQALLHGEVGTYLSAHPLMGPVAILVQVPFAAIGTGAISEFQWAAVPCLLAAAGLGICLAGVARRRGAGVGVQILLPLLCVVNPLTFAALQSGHPEEILAAALAVGAVAVASEGHGVRAALLLGLAIASKQWAVIAIFPTLMALPSRPLRTGALAGLLVAVLTLPGLIAAPGSFFTVQGAAASGGRIASIWSGWYAVTPSTTLHLEASDLTAHIHRLPTWMAPLTHPLIVALALALPLALWLWRGRFGMSGQEAMALLVLLGLARCALDPVDSFYYHVPVLLAALGLQAYTPQRLPLLGLTAVAIAWLLDHWSRNLGSPQAFNAAYVAIAVVAAVAIAMRLAHRPGRPATARSPIAPVRA